MSPRFETSLPAGYYPPRVKWRNDLSNEPSTPFGDASVFQRELKKRPLRVTLDIPTLVNTADRAVAQTFIDFHGSPLLEIRANDPRVPGGVSLPIVDETHPAHHQPRVVIRGDGFESHVSLMTLGEMREILDHYGLKEFKLQATLASFHNGWHGDLLVSSDPAMHELAKKVAYLGLHVVTPSVGLRLFGLLLRYHEQYIIRAKPNHIIGRWPFYWSLARQRLPAFWRFFSACNLCPDKVIGRTGGSILSRAARALEARDFVGYEHYSPASHDSADRSAYHFDYMLLLLTGALDAIALVAKACYGIKLQDYEVGFRREKFKKELVKVGGQEILDWLAAPEHKDTLIVLHELRNRIHGAGLQDVQSDEGILFEIPSDLKSIIPKIRRLCPDTICVSSDGRYLKHYPLAHALLDHALGIMDGVAVRMDVTRLLPTGKTIPNACLTVPKEDLFSGPSAIRISALG